jgi:threonine synthase
MAIAVEESRIVSWQQRVARAEGLMICPEAATCIGALEYLTETKTIAGGERIVIFNTAAGQKYFRSAPEVPLIDLNQPTDWEKFAAEYLNE